MLISSRRISRFAILPLFALLPGFGVARCAAQGEGPRVVISGSISRMVVASEEPAPVLRAAQDLSGDFAKVFGPRPAIVNSLDDADPVTILIAESDHLPAGVGCTRSTGREAFAFSVASVGSGAARRQIVCLVGSDMRGTIYAIYEFSQSVLGVDPMYLWTDKLPARRTSLVLPASFARVYPSPIFKYRGFFINDEDLLTGWVMPKKGEQTGIALSSWDMVFETILRLKGNMVVPGTWIFPDDAQVEAAAERGLIINQHHAIPLGVNVARWPRDVPYNYSTHPEILRRAWSNAVREYRPDEEVLWSVGLRGVSDSSYSRLDPSVRNNDPLLGRRISDAIADQIRIVRARYPHAQFVTDLWQEGARLMQEGDLKIPPEVTLVWADTGYGDMLDEGKVAAGEGMYFHVAVMNGHANQLSEMVSVKVIQSEIGRYIQAGATSYFLVNTSDIRPVVMTARAVMEMAWGGIPATTGGLPGDADAAYYHRWADEEFGAKSADALTSIYREYFAAPSLLTEPGSPTPQGAGGVPMVCGDQHYHSEARRIILDDLSGHQVFDIPSQSPKWSQPWARTPPTAEQRAALLERDIRDATAAQPRWDKVWKDAVAAESLIDPARRNYYQEAVLTMIVINRESNQMLLDVAQSMQDKDAGNAAKAQAEAAAALQSLDAVMAAMHAAEYGKWKNWYRGDWLTGVDRTRTLVQAYADHLKDPMAKLPAPAGWTGWEAYFHIMQYEDDRSVDVQKR